jgi:hypothetical protein
MMFRIGKIGFVFGKFLHIRNQGLTHEHTGRFFGITVGWSFLGFWKGL